MLCFIFVLPNFLFQHIAANREGCSTDFIFCLFTGVDFMIEGGLLLVTLVHPAILDLHHHAIDLVLGVVTIIPLLNEGIIRGMWFVQIDGCKVSFALSLV